MGKLLVIEGLDGSGKATQTSLLFSKLAETGKIVRKVSFPDYDSPSSALIKMYLSGEFGTRPDEVNAYAASSFYSVDRYAYFKREWEKDWLSGIVIADRYTTSNAIHQCPKIEKSKWDEYLDWLYGYEYDLLRIPKPDIVIYLKVDPIVSQKLLEQRYNEDEEKKDIHERDVEYLIRCQEAAIYCSERFGWKTVECTSGLEMRRVQDIHNEIMSIVEDYI